MTAAATQGASEAQTIHSVGWSPRFRFVAAAVTLLTWAIFQNLYKFRTATYLFDEPIYSAAGWRYVTGTIGPTPAGTQASLDNFEHPPLAKWLFGIAQAVVGHSSVSADRVVAGLCSVATGVLVAWWLYRMSLRWTGLLAGAFIVLLPETAGSVQPLRFARYGMLDPVAELFMVASIVLAWEWFSRKGAGAWWFAVATGIATGLSAGAKENGFLGVVGPIVLCLVLCLIWRSELRARLAQAVVSGGTAMTVFVALYLPLGDPIGKISYLFQFQLHHSQLGHMVGFAGRATGDPPWWTNFWFAGHGMGVAVTFALLISAVYAVVRVRMMVTWWCLAALAGPVLFHCFIAKVVLPFYWTLWIPDFVVLSALGLAGMVRDARALRRQSSVASRRLVALLGGVGAAAVAAITGVVVVAAVNTTWHVATLQLEGPAALPSVLAENHLMGTIVAAGMYQAETSPYLAGHKIVYSLPTSLADVDAIVIGQPRCRTLTDQGVRALVAANLANGTLHSIYTDNVITVYGSNGPLVAPTSTEIASQPKGNLSDDC